MSGALAIGCCHGPDDAASPYLSGFEYREATLSVLEDADRNGADLGALAAGCAPPIEIVMGLLPRGFRLFDGPDSVAAALARAEYVADVLRRSGARGLSFGAGAARTIPPGMPRREGEKILAEVLARMAALCAAIGARLYIENLPVSQSGTFNTVDEIAGFLDRYAITEGRIVYDLRAAIRQGDPLEGALRALALIGHVHVPYPPLPGTPSADSLLDRLLAAGYRGRISIEPEGTGVDEAVAVLGAHLRARVAGLRP